MLARAIAMAINVQSIIEEWMKSSEAGNLPVNSRIRKHDEYFKQSDYKIQYMELIRHEITIFL